MFESGGDRLLAQQPKTVRGIERPLPSRPLLRRMTALENLDWHVRVGRRPWTLNALGPLPGLNGRQDAEERETATDGRSSRGAAIRRIQAFDRARPKAGLLRSGAAKAA